MTAVAEDWNRAIGKAFFRPGKAEERVVLAIDEVELFKIARESGLTEKFNLADARDATEHLCVAVRQQIREHGWRPAPCVKDQLPPFLAVLAVFILAVFRMEEEESRSENAYWIRVLDLLEPRVAERLRAGERRQDPLPRGLNHQTFRAMWEAVEEWANRTQGGAWGCFRLPERRSGIYSSVGFVKAQALLRREDLDRLPRFFDRANLRPGTQLSIAEIREAVTPHRADRTLFSAHAQRVLGDDKRLNAAVEQIARRLERWDGTFEATAEPEAPRRRRRSRFDPWREPDEHVDPVRFVGGLKLDVRTWMAGAGPTLLVEDEILAALPQREVWIDGVCWPLDDGCLGPDVAPVLDRPGRHEVRVGERRLALEVAEPRLAAEAREPKPAWRVKAGSAAWPEHEKDAAMDDGPWLEGPWLEGLWAECAWPEVERASLARRWVELALAVRDGRWQVGRRKPESHLLLQQLHAAARRVDSSFSDRATNAIPRNYREGLVQRKP